MRVTIVIFKDKLGAFKDYQIIKDKSMEEIKKQISKYNENKSDYAYIETDEFILSVILKKESNQTMKRYSEQILEEISNARRSFESDMESIFSTMGYIQDFIKETKE